MKIQFRPEPRKKYKTISESEAEAIWQYYLETQESTQRIGAHFGIDYIAISRCIDRKLIEYKEKRRATKNNI